LEKDKLVPGRAIYRGVPNGANNAPTQVGGGHPTGQQQQQQRSSGSSTTTKNSNNNIVGLTDGAGRKSWPEKSYNPAAAVHFAGQ
jgi:hypothetical protein